MKKYVLLIMLCTWMVCFATGCAGAVEDNQANTDYSAAVMQTAAPTEEGYYVVEGTLYEFDEDRLSVKTAEGYILDFQLAPETVIYSKEGNVMEQGQEIKIVFDGKENGDILSDVSVIMVSSADI